MHDPFSIFREGGVVMYPLLLLAMGMPLVALIAVGTTAMRLRIPAVLWWCAAVTPLVVGLGGTLVGLDLTQQAVVHASREMQSKMAGNGLSVSLYALEAGSAISALAFAGFAASLGLGTAIGAGAESRWTLGHTAGALLVVPFVLVLPLAGSWLGAPVAALVSLGVLLVSLRLGTEDIDAARGAAARAAVGGLGGVALACALVCNLTWRAVENYQAFSMVSGEMRDLLMLRAQEGSVVTTGVLATAMGVVGLAALVSTGLAGKAVMSPRTLGSAALVGLLLVPVLGVLSFGAFEIRTVSAMAVDFAEVRAEAWRTHGLKLPVVPDRAALEAYSPGTVLTFASGRVTQDDVPTSVEQVVPERYMNLEASGSTKLSELSRFAKRLERSELSLAVQGARAGSLSLRIADTDKPRDWEDPGDEWIELDLPEQELPRRLMMVPDPKRDAGWILWEQTRPEQVVHLDADALQPGALGPLGEVRDVHGGVNELHLWMPKSGAVQQLVDAVVGARQMVDNRRLELVWRIDTAPADPESRRLPR